VFPDESASGVFIILFLKDTSADCIKSTQRHLFVKTFEAAVLSGKMPFLVNIASYVSIFKNRDIGSDVDWEEQLTSRYTYCFEIIDHRSIPQ